MNASESEAEEDVVGKVNYLCVLIFHSPRFDVTWIKTGSRFSISNTVMGRPHAIDIIDIKFAFQAHCLRLLYVKLKHFTPQ